MDKYEKIRLLETYAKIYHVLHYSELLEKADGIVKEWLFEITFDNSLPIRFRERIAELLRCINMYGFTSACVDSNMLELCKIVVSEISEK